MGAIPSTNSGPTLGDIPILAAPNPASYSPAPALAALQDAFKNGLVTSQDIQQLPLIAAQQRQQMQGINLDMANAPAKAALTAEQIQAARTALPAITAQDIAQANAGAAVAPVQAQATIAAAQPTIAAAPGATSKAASDANAAAILAKYGADAVQQDPSGTLAGNLAVWAEFGMTPPTNPDGSLNAPVINELGTRMKTMSVMWKTPAGQAATDLAGKKVGGWDALMKNFNDPTKAVSILSGLPDNIPGPQQMTDATSLAQLKTTIGTGGMIDEARKIVSDPSLNVVGPNWNQGSWTGEKMQQVKAFLGGNATKADAQSRLQKTLAQGVLNTLRSFAGSGVGQIRTAEIEYMEKAQPTLDNTSNYWNEWLNRADADLRQVYATHTQYLPASVAQGVADGSSPNPVTPLGNGSPSPSAPAAPSLPVVTNQAAWAALPVGTLYQDATGKTWTKK